MQPRRSTSPHEQIRLCPFHPPAPEGSPARPDHHLHFPLARGGSEVHVVGRQTLEAELAKVGAALWPVPIARGSYRLSRAHLLAGGATPVAAAETLHRHPRSVELYVVVEGCAEIHGAYLDGSPSIVQRAGPGDLVVIPAGVCHAWRWRSAQGFAYHFRAPQDGDSTPLPAVHVVRSETRHASWDENDGSRTRIVLPPVPGAA